MKLDTEFCRLPLRFDATRLAAEVAAFAAPDWRPDPGARPGNLVLPLVEPGEGMRATPHLERSPYLRQVLAALETVLGRTSLVEYRASGEESAVASADRRRLERVEVHVPILTHPEARLVCGERELHLPAGEAWVVDSWLPRGVKNPARWRHVHLVVETVGTPAFWARLGRGLSPFDSGTGVPLPQRFHRYRSDVEVALEIEGPSSAAVMTPWEQAAHLDFLFGEMRSAGSPEDAVAALEAARLDLSRSWRALWAVYEDRPDGRALYREAISAFRRRIEPLTGRLALSNGVEAVGALLEAVVEPALADEATVRFDRPIVIVSAPRAGSTLLYELLSRSPSLVAIGGESHRAIEGIPDLSPARRAWESNRLTAADATPEVVERLRARFLAELRTREGEPPRGLSVRMLEKTPKNALRVPFLDAVFPDALFIHLWRDPRESVASIIEAWKSGRFVTYPDLPGWTGPPWSLLLVPGWGELAGKPLPEIAACQWERANRILLDDLARLPRERWISLAYAELVEAPAAAVSRLSEFAGFDWDEPVPAELPPSRHTLTPPSRDKWRVHAAEIEPLLDGLRETELRLAALRTRSPVPSRSKDAPPDPGPIACVHTASLPEILDRLCASILVSTYQAGKVFVVRTDGRGLNTHFRNFAKPMGLAASGGRLAIGTRIGVWELQELPATAGSHDQCFVARTCHTTGELAIHEIAWGDLGELWIVNTRFSCLATLGEDVSFVPRWRPPFVTALAPEDRCHLNGLAMVDGRPRYVTAHAACDEREGWRAHKAKGGILVDVPSGEILAAGLSMPHSPRWHDGRLYVLESGEGALATIDPSSGRKETIARLPGFTRGLDFLGPYALVGLSQVRESAIFSGIPITERREERRAGVWVVDLASGRAEGFLRFDSGVQEIFAVLALPGARYPEVLTDDLTPATPVLPEDLLAGVPSALGP